MILNLKIKLKYKFIFCMINWWYGIKYVVIVVLGFCFEGSVCGIYCVLMKCVICVKVVIIKIFIVVLMIFGSV